jgi:hypothetical protein
MKLSEVVKKGGNGEQFKWLVTLNSDKQKKVTAATRDGVKDFLTPEQLIIGIKSIKKIKPTE